MSDTLAKLIKQQVITRQILSEVLDEVQKMKQVSNTNPSTSTEVQSIFAAFQHFPIYSDETLNLLEDYLSEKGRFKAAITEMSKMGGASPYDFMKRCLSSIITNGFASQFSWLGAKKKRVFRQLKVADLLLEAAQLNGVSDNRKTSEEAIKAWLRRAKERYISSLKKTLPEASVRRDANILMFLP
ncbi:unnamed protein product [Phaedon cochleariae]|uniref:DUF4806 domain-containing protein n=1 Tax=Phaedon cochleariae TaxID=80249 RepID=A0A9P0DIY6_PHACE|nr:unnamed protein product [Phaedon cochleariae]